MRILICGGREWASYVVIYNTLKEYVGKVEFIIEGGARGADSLGRIAAESLGMRVIEFPADWNKHGRSAGPIRNRQMLKEGNPDLILAFHDDISNSKGTKDMVLLGVKNGVNTIVIDSNGKRVASVTLF